MLCLCFWLLLGEQSPKAALACSACLAAPLHLPAVEDDGGFGDDRGAALCLPLDFLLKYFILRKLRDTQEGMQFAHTYRIPLCP